MARHATAVVALAGAVVCDITVCQAEDGGAGAGAFAVMLAKHGVPCGIVSPPAVVAWGRVEGPGNPETASKDPFGLGLGETLAAFNRHGPLFRATKVNGVVHIRAVDEPVEITRALLVETLFGNDSDGPAAGCIGLATSAIRAGEMRGVIGSGPLPNAESALNRRVHLSKGSYSALRVLDEVVKQASGVLWFVNYVPGQGGQQVSVGLMDSSGAYLKFTMNE